VAVFCCELTGTAVASKIKAMIQPIKPKQLIQTRVWVIVAVSLLAILIGVSIAVNVEAQATDDHFTYLPMVIRMSNEPVPFGSTFEGEGTYYDFADGNGNCTFGPSPNDLMVAAINQVQYNNAALCGAYAAVTGPKGSVVVRIVDQCPECPAGDLDFSPEAFAQIADLPQGRVLITWQLVSPVLDGPIVYHFKDGSNPWWTAVQIRNHRNPIAKFEYWDGSRFITLDRVEYNYFIEWGGMGWGPFTFRVTDVFGNQIVDSNIPLLDNADFPGQSQFPPPP
jgi:expansin (peptidoglycan-binding protein)